MLFLSPGLKKPQKQTKQQNKHKNHQTPKQTNKQAKPHKKTQINLFYAKIYNKYFYGCFNKNTICPKAFPNFTSVLVW